MSLHGRERAFTKLQGSSRLWFVLVVAVLHACCRDVFTTPVR